MLVILMLFYLIKQNVSNALIWNPVLKVLDVCNMI